MIEGALIAAMAVGADRVVFGLKRSFGEVVTRVRAAIAEMEAAGWTGDIEVIAFEGPDEYLYGEETALLEAIDGRYPFPRLAPPYRRGVDEVVETEADARSGSGQSSHVEMAGAFNETGAPPALVDNVETLANVPGIIARGGIVVPHRGHRPVARHHRVHGQRRGEPRRGGRVPDGHAAARGDRDHRRRRPGRPRRSSACSTACPTRCSTPADLDAPVSYEGLAAVGSGLGSAGFVVFDDRDDLVAAVAGVSRFLAVESCGQCTPCKQGGLALSGLLDKLSRSAADERDLAAIHERVETVADGARCFLASQQEVVVRSLLDRFDDVVQGHLSGRIAGRRTHAGVRAGRHRRRDRRARRAPPRSSSPTGPTARPTRARPRPTATASTGPRRRCPTDRRTTDRNVERHPTERSPVTALGRCQPHAQRPRMGRLP